MATGISPAWFYSTLAQSTAAVIGLTIAFTISTHLSRRERRRKRTDDLKRETIEFSEKYQPIIDTIAEILRTEGKFTPSNVRYDLINNSNPKQWADNQRDSKVAIAWAYVSGISDLLDDIDYLDAELSSKQISEMNNAARELTTNVIHPETDSSKEVYRSLKNTPIGPLRENYIFHDFLDEKDRINAWLDRYLTARHSNRITFTGYDERFSGKNIYSIYTVLDELKRDGQKLGIISTESVLTASIMSPGFAQKIIINSMKMGLAGIILPVLLLISSPQASAPQWLFDPLITMFSGWGWIVDWGILVIQIILLIVTLFYALRIFILMIFEVAYEVPDMATALGVGKDESTDDSPDRKSYANKLILWISGLESNQQN